MFLVPSIDTNSMLVDPLAELIVDVQACNWRSCVTELSDYPSLQIISTSLEVSFLGSWGICNVKYDQWVR